VFTNLAIVIVEIHLRPKSEEPLKKSLPGPAYDITGDLNQERVEYALVPLGEDVAHLLIREA
jgi:hypothetical protein